jgi:hypothetical protein
MRHILKSACFAACLAALPLGTLPVSAGSGEAPTLPTAAKAKSKTKIKYEDLDYLLGEVVLPLGRSDHRPALTARAETGTKMKRGNPKPSRFEGNRVMFHFIQSDDEKQFVYDVRDNLLALPEQISLEKISRHEQLAFWLNLHNSIMLAEMADRYPTTLVKNMIADCSEKPDTFVCDKRFSFLGQNISVTDIRQHVISNWQDPLVIYGFYMGAVGTPNIRTKAFTGTTVYEALESNAVDFVNSVRGSNMSGSKRLRVSRYYTAMSEVFPNFEADLIRHIQKYARGMFKFEVQAAETVHPNIDDWYIADLFNGKRISANSLTIASREGLSSNNGFKYPLHVQELLKGVIDRHKRRRGQVSVETVPNATPEDLKQLVTDPDNATNDAASTPD